MAQLEHKIVVDAYLGVKMLEILQQEKEDLEEKMFDIDLKIENLQNALKAPVEALDKKDGTDFALSVVRVKALLSKQSGLSIEEYRDILAIELNLDRSNADVMKSLRGRIYQHLHAMKKKNESMSEYIMETAKTVWFPCSSETPVIPTIQRSQVNGQHATVTA